MRTLRAIYENNVQLCHDTVSPEIVEHLLRMADSQNIEETTAVFQCLQAMVSYCLCSLLKDSSQVAVDDKYTQTQFDERYNENFADAQDLVMQALKETSDDVSALYSLTIRLHQH